MSITLEPNSPIKVNSPHPLIALARRGETSSLKAAREFVSHLRPALGEVPGLTELFDELVRGRGSYETMKSELLELLRSDELARERILEIVRNLAVDIELASALELLTGVLYSIAIDPNVQLAWLGARPPLLPRENFVGEFASTLYGLQSYEGQERENGDTFVDSELEPPTQRSIREVLNALRETRSVPELEPRFPNRFSHENGWVSIAINDGATLRAQLPDSNPSLRGLGAPNLGLWHGIHLVWG